MRDDEPDRPAPELEPDEDEGYGLEQFGSTVGGNDAGVEKFGTGEEDGPGVEKFGTGEEEEAEIAVEKFGTGEEDAPEVEKFGPEETDDGLSQFGAELGGEETES